MEQIKSQKLILIAVAVIALLVAFVLFKDRFRLSPEPEIPTPEENSETQNEDQTTNNEETVNLPTPVELNNPIVEIQGEQMIVRLSWKINEEANPDFLMYKIYRDTDSDFNAGVLPIAEILIKDRRNHVELGLKPGTYYYRLTVIDKDKNRADSNVITAKP